VQKKKRERIDHAMKQIKRLTRAEKKKIYKTAEKYNRIKKENARVKHAIELNKELNK